MVPTFRRSMSIITLLTLLAHAAEAAWKETILASFKAGNGVVTIPTGYNPSGGLIFDAAGSLYGVNYFGGPGGNEIFGTVFKLTPPAGGKTTWNEIVISGFYDNDGANPDGSLIFDSAGNLYGTTYDGGAYGGGAVFELTPPAAGQTAWNQIVLASFAGSNGAGLSAGLTLDAAGNLYGTTGGGGTHGNGTVFELTPPVAGKTTWTETVLVNFDAGSKGSSPGAGLVMDKAGNLYGTTRYGGNIKACPGMATDHIPAGCGVVFKLTPPAAGTANRTETVLASFNGTDGLWPEARLTIDASGNLYGTTYLLGSGGLPSGCGTVFKVAPPAMGHVAWTKTVLTSFQHKGDGCGIVANVIVDAKGNVYGTSLGGGALGYGSVFELSPPASGEGAWKETHIFSFNHSDGYSPWGGVILDAAGNLYGTTAGGGMSSGGTVFKLTP